MTSTSFIHQGDCLDFLRTLPSDSVHCCVTSPPYWGLRDYGVEGQIGMESRLEDYVAKMVEVFREVRRVLRPDGTCWLNLGDAYATRPNGTIASRGRKTPHAEYRRTNALRSSGSAQTDGLKHKDLMLLPSRVAIALQDDGWWLRSEIIWAKPNPMPESCRDRPTSAHEKVFLLTKSERYFYDADAVRSTGPAYGGQRGTFSRPADTKVTQNLVPGHRTAQHRPDRNDRVPAGSNLRNVWTIPTEPCPEAHFATFPRRLVEPCVKAGTSEKGCCPECGAPWVRVVSDGAPDLEWQRSCGGDASGGYAGTARKSYADARAQDPSAVKTRILAGMCNKETTGWRQTCSCPPANPKPCTVLDPFTGSGTTGVVALRVSRAFLGCELNPQYHVLACERVKAAALGLSLRELRSGQGSLLEWKGDPA